ncbi:MAG TPA: methylated-DNA--[protein]-cysteine S-methyltransferase [Sphaerochaeta sp.]|nr:methylated-DNA--[protein]-cysteine S-methyltransferase [Sphaerochaeta sp.]
MVTFTYYMSPVGLLELSATTDALYTLDFVNDERVAASNLVHPLLDYTKAQLDEYFAGDRTAFSIPLHLAGTDFQEKVWRALLTIGYGETRSYGAIAVQVGSPKASRAVGMANNRNPIGIIIPCHRVIGSDGSLVGFGGGLEKKIWLLNHEGVAVKE